MAVNNNQPVLHLSQSALQLKLLRHALFWGFGFDLFEMRWRGVSRTALGVV